MKRQEVQGPVRDDYYVWRADLPDERGHQPVIKFIEPEPRGLHNLLGMNHHILASQRELAELELQTRLRLEDVAGLRKPANDFCLGSRHNEGEHLVTRREILDQSCPFRKIGLNGIDLGNRDLPQRRIRRIHF